MKINPSFKIALIFGTRPEIIKLSSIIRLLEKRKISYFMIHTGQHYSPSLDKIFFKQLELPQPHYHLNIRSKASYLQGRHIARMLIDIEKILLQEQPTHVLIQGDTNTALAGTLAASKISTTQSSTGYHYIIGHVEAGLRSYDRQMPEEINRFISDHFSDFLFAPTQTAKKNLEKEGMASDRIFVIGNTIVDAVFQNFQIAKTKVNLEKLIPEKEYVLVTLHRQENVDEKKRFNEIINGLVLTAEALDKKMIWPIHPRAQAKLQTFGIKIPKIIQISKPIGFLEFLMLESHADLIMTDSGGIQEEACILNKPCVTLRTTTERPETLEVGANTLSGVEPDHIVQAAIRMTQKKKRWKSPFGDGQTSNRILNILENHTISRKNVYDTRGLLKHTTILDFACGAHLAK